MTSAICSKSRSSTAKDSTTRWGRYMASAVLSAGLGVATLVPTAHAQDGLTRVLVDVANVVLNNGTPYYGQGGYTTNERLVTGRDAYGRPVYYRQVPAGYRQPLVYDRYGRQMYDQYGRRIDYSHQPLPSRHYGRSVPPYGNAYGYYRNGRGSHDLKCNKHGKCKRNKHDRDDDHDDDHDDRNWDGRRWRDDD